MTKKLNKLIQRTQELAEFAKHQNLDLAIQQKLDWFRYLEMAERLKTLKEQRDEAEKRLNTVSGFIETQYKEIFCAWKKDVRWLSAHCRSNQLNANRHQNNYTTPLRQLHHGENEA